MRRPSVLLLAGWLAISPLILSCGSSPPVQHATSTATSTSTATATPSATQAQTKTASPDYIIGPGDVLQVFVWRNPELSVTVPVRPDGKISTPLVENMVAVGKTAPQLSRDMEGVLSEYVRSPKVNIIVTHADSVFSHVNVVGQVTHPQPVAYREGMTVLDAVLAVGGLTQFASGNRARIVRMENGKETVIKVKVADLVNNGDVRQNVPLKPGDVLVIPQSMF
ncbi:MAG TPA: XrtA/PEP-CTERM system exopolysaccharide export protein [Steroidobacteraceae bacterium]|nr:XrtA/PEP-CTERM system exopolysaccharide export protein [Steroidobacteraceae bacterium]